MIETVSEYFLNRQLESWVKEHEFGVDFRGAVREAMGGYRQRKQLFVMKDEE